MRLAPPLLLCHDSLHEIFDSPGRPDVPAAPFCLPVRLGANRVSGVQKAVIPGRNAAAADGIFIGHLGQPGRAVFPLKKSDRGGGAANADGWGYQQRGYPICTIMFDIIRASCEINRKIGQKIRTDFVKMHSFPRRRAKPPLHKLPDLCPPKPFRKDRILHPSARNGSVQSSQNGLC